MSRVSTVYEVMDSPLGTLIMCVDGDGFLIELGVLTDGAQSPHSAAQAGTNAAASTIQAVKDQLGQYFDGKRTSFDLPVSVDRLRGTAFQKKVWQALLRIPYGSSVSYSDIACSVENPAAVRAVGGAIGKNPLLLVIPCHRVIGKDGSLTGFSAGIERKIALLAIEKRTLD